MKIISDSKVTVKPSFTSLKIDSSNFNNIIKKPMNTMLSDIFEISCNKLSYESSQKGVDVLMRAYEDKEGVKLLAKVIDDINPRNDIHKAVLEYRNSCVGKTFKELDRFFRELLEDIKK